MNYIPFNFAEAEAEQHTDLFTSIGIDWRLLIIQTVAFLVLLWVLKKWVYPPLIAMLDKRDKAVADAAEAANEAQKMAAESHDQTEQLLKQARAEAADIVSTAKDEANDMLARADSKSKAHADAILEAAKDDIAKEVTAAKKALHNETIELVAAATEKVASQKVTAGADEALIEQALGEVK